MSNGIIPFDNATRLPVRATRRDIAKDLQLGQNFPSLSIKGKHFSVVIDGTSQMLMRPEDRDTPISGLNLVVLRANDKARVYYQGIYDPDNSSVPPDCFTNDGATPDASVSTPQHTHCALCPHAVFGSGREGRGSACRQVTRLAVAVPHDLSRAYLLRLPITSVKDKAKRAGFKDAVAIAKERGYQYNEVVFRVLFDHEAESPKLLFRPHGILDNDRYAEALHEYDNKLVREIVGLPPVASTPAAAPATVAAAPAPADFPAPVAAPPAAVPTVLVPTVLVPTGVVPTAPAPAPLPPLPASLDAALDVFTTEELAEDVAVAAPTPAPAPAPAAEKKPRAPRRAAAPAPTPAAAPAAAPDAPADPAAGDPLLAGLDDLLGGFDD